MIIQRNLTKVTFWYTYLLKPKNVLYYTTTDVSLKTHSNHGVYVCFVCFKRTHENIGNLLLILVSVFWQEDRTEHKLSHFCGPSSHKHVTIVTWYTNYVRQTLGWKNIISQTKAPFVEEDIDYGETTYHTLYSATEGGTNSVSHHKPNISCNDTHGSQRKYTPLKTRYQIRSLYQLFIASSSSTRHWAVVKSTKLFFQPILSKQTIFLHMNIMKPRTGCVL